MRPGLHDTVHVPRLDGLTWFASETAIGTIVKLVPFNKFEDAPCLYDRVLVEFPDEDRVLCWHDEVKKVEYGT